MGKQAHTYNDLMALVQQGCSMFAQINKNKPYVIFHKLSIDSAGNISTEEYYPDGNLSGNRNNPASRMDFDCSFNGNPNSRRFIPKSQNFGTTYFEEYGIGQKVLYSGSDYNYTITIN